MSTPARNVTAFIGITGFVVAMLGAVVALVAYVGEGANQFGEFSDQMYAISSRTIIAGMAIMVAALIYSKIKERGKKPF